MTRIFWARDSEKSWKLFNKERGKRANKLAKLPFARKAEIIEKMQSDTVLLKKAQTVKSNRSKSSPKQS